MILDFCVVKSRMYTDVNQVLLKIKLKYSEVISPRLNFNNKEKPIT